MESLATGLFEKMLILAFEDAEGLERGTLLSARRVYRVLINPETYSKDHKVSLNSSGCASDIGQPSGTSGKQARFNFTAPEEMKFDFLFDSSGVIDMGRSLLGDAGVSAELKYFKDMLVGYHGKSHSPFHLMLVWGTLIFKGVATGFSVNYKLFNANGIPIRATASVTFRASILDSIRIAKENNSSPDLTHVIQAKAGDTLPLLCKKVYGDPKYYLQVAEANGLGNFRRLEPGMELVFPPIDKTAN